jgi:hypothetical protein
MTKPKPLQILLLTLAAALFVFALTQPVWKCGKGGFPFDGISVLAIGIMGLMFLNPAWFSNVILILAVICAFRRSRLGPTWIPVVAAGMATTTLVGPYLCAVTGGPLGEGTGLDTGALSWVVSIWLASISVLLAPPKAPPPSTNVAASSDA